MTIFTSSQVDFVAAATTYTRERDEYIDFSQVYFMNEQGVLIDKNQDMIFEKLTDLEGKTIAARSGTTSLKNLEIVGSDLHLEIKTIDSTKPFTEVIELLQTGEIDAFTSDRTLLDDLAQKYSNLVKVTPLVINNQEPYAIGVPQGNSDLRKLIDYTLQQLQSDDSDKDDESDYAEIYTMWFPDKSPYFLETSPGQFGKSLYDSNSPCRSAYEKIVKNEPLIVGVKEDFKPFGFKENDTFDGFEVDIAKEFARRWFGDEAKIEFKPVTSANRIRNLLDCEVDLVIASMTYQWDRARDIDFSQIYFFDGQSLLTNQSDIQTLKDLTDRTVACIQGSTSCDTLAGLEIKFDDSPDVQTAVNALSDEVVAFTSDSAFLTQYALDHPQDNLRIINDVFSEEPYAIGLRQNDDRLRELVNFTLQDMKRDGTYEALYNKWFNPIKTWLKQNQPDAWFAQQAPYPIQVIPGQANYLPQPKLLNSKIRLIRDRGYLLVGVKDDFLPYGDYKAGQAENNQRYELEEFEGFDIDIVRAIAEEWGVEVKLVAVTSANRIPKLLAGEIDMIVASMTHTADRDELIDFSQTYIEDGQSLLVRQSEGITGVNQTLIGKTVGVLPGSTSKRNLEAEAEKQGIAGQFTIEEFDDVEEIKTALLSTPEPKIDAFTTDSLPLARIVADYPDKLEIVGGIFTEEPYGIGLPPGDSFFRDIINCTLYKLEENEYSDIYKKWFLNGTPSGGKTGLKFTIESLKDVDQCFSFEAAPTDINLSRGSIVEQMKQTGYFTAGVRYTFPPYGYLSPPEEGNKNLGFDVDLMKEFARRWFNDENAVKFVEVEPSNRERKLNEKEVQIVAAAMSQSNKRDNVVDFSQTYATDTQAVLLHNSDDGLVDLSDLNNAVVSAVMSTTHFSTIKENLRRYANQEGIELEVRLYDPAPPSFLKALEDFSEARTEAVVSDKTTLDWKALNERDTLGDVIVLEVPTSAEGIERYGLAVPQFDELFRDLVNFTLQEMKKDGTYDAIYFKWFQSCAPTDVPEIWPGQPTLKEYLGINVTRQSDSPGLVPECQPDQSPDNPPDKSQNALEYIVQSDDTLSKIAEKCYGDLLLYPVLYDANHPERIPGSEDEIADGVTLLIPLDLKDLVVLDTCKN